jgi:enoyl-CoA hydratase/carnithine racemase
MRAFETIVDERPAPHVARIVLNRPEARNAQDTRMLYELNDAFAAAARDDEVKVIVLAANGPHFSAGHDLRELNTHQKMPPSSWRVPIRRRSSSGSRVGAAGDSRW